MSSKRNDYPHNLKATCLAMGWASEFLQVPSKSQIKVGMPWEVEV